MSGPTLATVKRLFSLAGNECAFPDCTNVIVDAATGTVLGDICHIRGRNSGSARYDAQQTDADRHSFENLVLMCALHHRLIDSSGQYSAEALLAMKFERERRTTAAQSAAAHSLARSHDVASRLLAHLAPRTYRLYILYIDVVDGRLRTSVIEHFEPDRLRPLRELLPLIIDAVNAHGRPAPEIDCRFRVFSYETREWVDASAPLPVKPTLQMGELVLVHENLLAQVGVASVQPYVLLLDSSRLRSSSANPTPAPAGWRR